MNPAQMYRAMHRKGWDTSSLAKKSGVPRSAIQKYILGRGRLTKKDIDALTKALEEVSDTY